jgi:large subunit ribosomal protein L23
MGLLDRFKKRFEGVGKDKGVKHPVGPADAKSKAEAEKRRQFAAVPSGKPERAKGPEKPEAKGKERKTPVKRETGLAPRVLLSAVVTEKSTRLSASNQVVFDVAPDATKHAVARAVKDLYGVEPAAVRVVNVQGKFIRYGRTTGRTKHRRKAIVVVPPGKRITVTEGV